MAALPAPPLRSHSLPAVTGGSTFWTTHRLPSIVESRYARDYIPKFQAKFGVAEEEADGPRLGLPRHHALETRTNRKVVSERLSHSIVATTMDIYSHVLLDIQDQAALAIDKKLSRADSF